MHACLFKCVSSKLAHASPMAFLPFQIHQQKKVSKIVVTYWCTVVYGCYQSESSWLCLWVTSKLKTLKNKKQLRTKPLDGGLIQGMRTTRGSCCKIWTVRSFFLMQSLGFMLKTQETIFWLKLNSASTFGMKKNTNQSIILSLWKTLNEGTRRLGIHLVSKSLSSTSVWLHQKKI